MTVHFRDAIGGPHEASFRGYGRIFYRSKAKRLIDVILVILVMPAVLPVLMGLIALVCIDGHAPIYRQKRVGRGGRIYTMLKIRTMVPQADARLAEYLESNSEARIEWDRDQKLRNDPRVTPVGRVLRKLSLDELPQLWNVLKGEMSLVGPRPIMVGQESLYPGAAYYEMRPGLTGPWQISDRNRCSFAARAQFDQEYYQTQSFSTDTSIIVKTIAVVAKGTGC